MPPRRLSAGQRQRGARARALAAKPELLLADERPAALDAEAGRAAVEPLRDLARRRDCALVVVSRDHRILDVADRVLALASGALVEVCDPERTTIV